MNKKMLLALLMDLSKYHRERESILEYCVQERLTNSLNSYYKELEDSLKYLMYKKDIRLIKNIEKVWGDT